MKNIFLILSIFCLAVSAYAEDDSNYNSGGYSPSREVAEQTAYFAISQGAIYSSAWTLPKVTHTITISNTHATQSLYVSTNGLVPMVIAGTDATTTAGSAVIGLGTSASGLGISEGDFITLNEGDANDGVYVITDVSGNFITVGTALAVDHSGNQNYAIQSPVVGPGEKITFTVGTKTFSMKASGASTTAKVYITYQTDLS